MENKLKYLSILLPLGTACLCLLAVVTAIIIGVIKGTLSSELLGEINGLTTGTGLLGVCIIFYLIIRTSLKKIEIKNE